MFDFADCHVRFFCVFPQETRSNKKAASSDVTVHKSLLWLYRANLITKSDDVTLDPSYVADNSRRELYYSAIQQKSSAVHFNFIFSLMLRRVQVLARLFLVLMLTSSCLHCARQCSHETIDFTWCFYFSPCFILTTRFLLCLSRPKLSTQPWNFNFCFVWLLNYFHDEDNFTTTKLLRFAFAENLNTKFTDSQSLRWLLCTIIWRKRLRLFAAGRRKTFPKWFSYWPGLAERRARES